jgi:hypothetical protein
MSEPGSRTPLAPDAEARLRAHVAAILDAAAVPSSVRTDLAEELLGHLEERISAYRAGGVRESDAVERAIADLGSVDRLGRDFGRTYHSRLWASTLGILLPAVAARDERPAAVGWLRLTLGVVFGLVGIALIFALPQLTPVRALAALVSGAVDLCLIGLAFVAIARGQRWALWYGLGVTILMLVSGIGSVLATAPGSTTIPLGAVLAVLVLLVAYGDRHRLREFVAGSRPVNRWLAVALALSLLVPAAAPVVATVPDPTQASASDLVLKASMQCDPDNRRVTLVADMTWRRTDLLPQGLAGLFHASDDGDSAGFRLLNEAPGAPIPAWLLASGDVPVIDVATGATAGWFGSTAQSVLLLPDTIGSFTIGIDPSAIRAGHTLRATWVLSPTSDGDTAWPSIEVAYAHLDRFLLEGTASCGETVTAQQVPLPSPESHQVQMGPFNIQGL